MASPKLGKQDPWERLESLVAESKPDTPEHAFGIHEVAARKGWSYNTTWKWLESQVCQGKLLKHRGTGSKPNLYSFPPKV